MDKTKETSVTVGGGVTSVEAEATEQNKAEPAVEQPTPPAPITASTTTPEDSNPPKLVATTSSRPIKIAPLLSPIPEMQPFTPPQPAYLMPSSPPQRIIKSQQAATNDILMIEDSTRDHVPVHLASLFNILEPRRPSRADILAIVVYAHALESGFYPSGAVQAGPPIVTSWSYSFNVQFVRAFSSVLPDHYRGYDAGSYEFRLELFGLSRQYCLLLARETDDSLCINFITEQRAHTVIVLPISRYITRQSLRTPAKCVQNVKELGRRLRNELFGPMRNAVLASGAGQFPGLLGIPEELQRMIIKYLDDEALYRLVVTCSAMESLVSAYFDERC